MRNILAKTLMLPVSVILLSTSAAEAKKMKIWVKESKAPCQGVAPMECLQVKYKAQDTAWQYMYSSIEGFNYEPGYQYKLSVKRTKVANPPADASAYKYELVKVMEKKQVQNSQQYWNYIYKNNWKLIQLNGQTLTNSKVNIQFDGQEKRFSGSAGCNRMFGTYTSEGNNLTFSAAASTRMACLDAETSKTETQVLQAISNQQYTFDVADQTLNLYKNGKIVMMFGTNGPAEKK